MALRTPTSLRVLSRQRFSSFVSSRHHVRRNLATATSSTASTSLDSSVPPPSTPSDPKISKIVDDISGLTLLQAADLVSLLKSRLNIQEIAMPTAAAAPVAAVATEEAPAEEKPKEKTVFNVKLESFDASAKPKMIREVKAMNPTLTLVAAKAFVESLPKVLKENLPKEEAEKMKKAFEAQHLISQEIDHLAYTNAKLDQITAITLSASRKRKTDERNLGSYICSENRKKY